MMLHPEMLRQLKEVRDAIHGLAQAWRGDWSDFDGRTLRDQLIVLRDALEEDAPRFLSEDFLLVAGICPTHHCWTDHCGPDCRGEVR